MPAEPAPVEDITGARTLAVLGDSVTTDHISPAGSIKADSPAGKYLREHGVDRRDFNSYGSRRGNHEVMIRGTFANIRLRNQLVPGTEGGVTKNHLTGETTTIYDASRAYIDAGIPLVVLAGKEYGSGSSRDWAAKGTALLGRQGGHRRELRAHPPVEPDRHGRAAAAVPRGPEPRVARPDRRRGVHDHRRSPRSTTATTPRTVKVKAGRRRSSTPASASTPPARRTTTATAGSCSTSCGRCAGSRRLMDLGLGGRGYLLTGASRGLGFATARALVDDGARVLISSRSADAVAAAVAELGGAPSAFGLAADLADPDAAERLVAEARGAARPGRRRADLASAARRPAPCSTSPRSDWRAGVESVLLGPLRLVKALVPHLGDGAAIGFVLSTSVRAADRPAWPSPTGCGPGWR